MRLYCTDTRPTTDDDTFCYLVVQLSSILIFQDDLLLINPFKKDSVWPAPRVESQKPGSGVATDRKYYHENDFWTVLLHARFDNHDEFLCYLHPPEAGKTTLFGEF
eukprot:5194495-Pleurochrysis_carterae.AAC.8